MHGGACVSVARSVRGLMAGPPPTPTYPQVFGPPLPVVLGVAIYQRLRRGWLYIIY